MGELALFQPREALDAETRLADFIRHARDDLTVFGAELDWDAPTWQLRGVARVSGRSKSVLRVILGPSPEESAEQIDRTLRTARYPQRRLLQGLPALQVRACPTDEP